ncbi:MAG: COX15/CtaA family protein [Nostocoides sp.]
MQSPPRPASGTKTADWLDRALVVNLALEVLIVVTGGTVRVTSSGLGCPTWPNCTPDSFVPVADQAEGFHKFIEYGNRLLTPVVGIAAVLVVLAIWRYAADRPALKRLAFLPLAGVLLQAVIGGVTVRVKLNPAAVSLHFLASMVLVALSTYLLYRYREGADGPVRALVPSPVRILAYVEAALTAVVLVMGTLVTGTGPHSGDRDVHRYPFDPQMMSWLHADLVMVFFGFAIGIYVAAKVTAAGTSAPRAWLTVIIIGAAQGLIGYAQYFTGLPEVLVLLHMLGASLLVIAVTFGVLSLRDRGPAQV